MQTLDCRGAGEMQPFTEEVVKIIKEIPRGRVMTYGQVAKAAGSPRAARQVVWVLHSMSRKHSLPWHRVVNAKGRIAIAEESTAEDQRILLEDEGVEISSQGFVLLEKYQLQSGRNR